MKDEDYWFKPKTHGYGASPVNWKGWAATLGFGVVIIALSLVFVVWPVLTASGPRLEHILAWLVLEAVALIYFMRLCRRKTDGEWQWRWGQAK